MPASVANQDRVLLTDATVVSMTALGGAAVAVLGQVETVEINLKRDKVDVTASADGFSSQRAIRWGIGSASFTGFSQLAGSKFAALFNGAAHAVLSITESSTGDVWQVVVFQDEYKKSMGKEATKDSITMSIEGTPWYAAAAGTPTALALGA